MKAARGIPNLRWWIALLLARHLVVCEHQRARREHRTGEERRRGDRPAQLVQDDREGGVPRGRQRDGDR